MTQDTPSIAASEGDWIEWKGGECPVPPETLVAIILRSGTVCGDKFPLTALHWDDCDSDEPSNWLHTGAADDIIAYRIVRTALQEQSK